MTKASQIKYLVEQSLGTPPVEESLRSTMSNALRSLFGKGQSQTSLFGIIDSRKYLMHELPGAPICEFFQWKEGSLILVLRILPTADPPTAEPIRSYKLELLAGEALTLDPTEDFKEEGAYWILRHADMKFKDLWNKFDHYKREIERLEGLSFVDGFVGDWGVVKGNLQLLLTKMNH